MPRYAKCAVLCCAVPCHAVLCHAVVRCAVMRHAMACYALLQVNELSGKQVMPISTWPHHYMSLLQLIWHASGCKHQAWKPSSQP